MSSHRHLREHLPLLPIPLYREGTKAQRGKAPFPRSQSSSTANKVGIQVPDSSSSSLSSGTVSLAGGQEEARVGCELGILQGAYKLPSQGQS